MKEEKTGNMIRQLRKERGWTQDVLANVLHVSNRTISKWECAKGLPDIHLLKDLSALFQVPLEVLLSGNLNEKTRDKGVLHTIRFYHCSSCNNFMISMNSASCTCCGRRMESLQEKSDSEHRLQGVVCENEWYFTLQHPMEKTHYIDFVAMVQDDRLHYVKLYPEQSLQVRMPYAPKATIYLYCSKHGLLKQKIDANSNELL